MMRSIFFKTKFLLQISIVGAKSFRVMTMASESMYYSLSYWCLYAHQLILFSFPKNNLYFNIIYTDNNDIL